MTVQRTLTPHTVVLGAGPAGLAAAYRLAQAEQAPVVLERGDRVGGLMRSVEKHDCSVDIGRKELYSRIPEVFELWMKILGEDYVLYPHRVGVLYEGTIMERSRIFQGWRRGLPWPLLLRGVSAFALQQLANPFLGAPKNEEQFWYRSRGKVFARALSQGFKEKFSGQKWADLPTPESQGSFLVNSLRSVFGRALADESKGKLEWRHPARGSGQIPKALAAGVRDAGGLIQLECQVTGLEVGEGRVDSVLAEMSGESVCFKPDHVVSSLPLPILARLLGKEPPKDLKRGDTKKRSTLIAYLFLDAPPRFEHDWLDVTDPDVQMGRVTNFSGFGGRMVPEGKSCLSVEFFCVEGDVLLDASDDEVRDLALRECAEAGLVDPERCFDRLLLRLPGAYAADDGRSWQSPGVQASLAEINALENLWYINRAGTDIATHAGLTAAEAILSGDRAMFLEKADPARPLGIASTRLWKAKSKLVDEVDKKASPT